MSLRKGPFTIKWNGNTINDVEEIDVEIDQDTEDRSNLGGVTYELDGPIKAGATLQLLRSDLPTLALVLPQYFVPNGGTLSTGEKVTNSQGAIDIKAASCNSTPVYGPLDIISCGNPGQVFRLVNARTKIDNIEFNQYLGVVSVRFIGEPDVGDANVQFFKEGSIAVVS